MRNLALLMLGLLALPSYAKTNVNIYRAQVAITQDSQDSQSDADSESEARVEGMKRVIVRATGDTTAIDNPVVSKALDSSAHYLSQFSYSDNNAQNRLNMLFNATQIRNLLSQAKLPFWPQERPDVLVWFVDQQGFDRSVLWENSGSDKVASLKAQAQLRGLPLLVPVGDFDDITGISSSDLWGGFAQPIAKASERYSPDAVLVVRSQNNQLRWTLYDETPEKMTDSSAEPLSGTATGDDAIKQVVDEVSNYYAKQSAVVVSNESSESILVKFLNVNKASDFFTLEKDLKALNSVASLDIQKIKSNELTFRVHLLANKNAFIQEVNGIKQIVALDNPLGDDTGSAPATTSDSDATPVATTESDSQTASPDAEKSAPNTDSQPVTVSSGDGSADTNSDAQASVSETPADPWQPVVTDAKQAQTPREYDLIYQWQD